MTLTAMIGSLLLAGLSTTSASGVEPAQAGGPTPFLQEFPDDTPDVDLPVGFAWGANSYGQIGDGTTINRLSPVQIDGGNQLDSKEFNIYAPGLYAACGVSEGTANCWGSNSSGQLGDGTFVDKQVAVPVKGLLQNKKVSDIAVGDRHACAISDGVPYCWGDNTYGQLGANFNGQSSSVPVAVSMAGVLSGKYVTAITTGSFHTCVIAEAKAYCWGWNFQGQLGYKNPDPQKEFEKVPVAVKGSGALSGKLVTSIMAGGGHTCAIASGKAYCWGTNSAGQLGRVGPSSTDPVAVDTTGVLKDRIIDSITSGLSSSCVIASIVNERRAYCWGANWAGELGVNNQNIISSPVPVAVFMPNALVGKNISSITNNCLIAVGVGYCWGNRGGDGNTMTDLVPTAIDTNGVLATRRLTTISASPATDSSGGRSGIGGGIATTKPSFTDVTPQHVFYDDIYWIAGTGIAQGYIDGEYKPEQDNSRQAMSAFVYRLKHLGQPKPLCTGDIRKFTDVGKNHPFCGQIEWLVDAGIVPIGDGKFHPAEPMTRGSMADWIFRGHHPGVADQVCAADTIFIDVKKETPGCGNILWLINTGVTTGYLDNTYKPGDPVTRQAMSAFMHRVMELEAH